MDLLPEEFQDNRTDHVSLQDIEDKCNQRDAETEYQQTQREKTRRIYLYKQMVERGEEISYLPKQGVRGARAGRKSILGKELCVYIYYSILVLINDDTNV